MNRIIMKIKIIYIMLACCMLLGCQKEDELSPSYGDVDYFAVQDSDDPLDHLRYLIYSERDLAIFYNDTLGSEERYDEGGNPYMYYEVLKIGYTISGFRNFGRYVLADDREDVMDMVELMNEYLFEFLPVERYPLSYLLTDSLIVTNGSQATIKHADNYYKGMTTTCVGNIEQVKYMSDSARQSFISELVGLELVNDVLGNELNEEILLGFDTVMTKATLDYSIYAPNKLSRYEGYGITQIASNKRIPEAELFGMLRYREEVGNRVYALTREQDYACYIGLILANTDAEIRKRYEKYPLVLKKYEGMLEMMENSDILKYRQVNNN